MLSTKFTIGAVRSHRGSRGSPHCCEAGQAVPFTAGHPVCVDHCPGVTIIVRQRSNIDIDLVVNVFETCGVAIANRGQVVTIHYPCCIAGVICNRVSIFFPSCTNLHRERNGFVAESAKPVFYLCRSRQAEGERILTRSKHAVLWRQRAYFLIHRQIFYSSGPTRHEYGKTR